MFKVFIVELSILLLFTSSILAEEKTDKCVVQYGTGKYDFFNCSDRKIFELVKNKNTAFLYRYLKKYEIPYDTATLSDIERTESRRKSSISQLYRYISDAQPVGIMSTMIDSQYAQDIFALTYLSVKHKNYEYIDYLEEEADQSEYIAYLDRLANQFHDKELKSRVKNQYADFLFQIKFDPEFYKEIPPKLIKEELKQLETKARSITFLRDNTLEKVKALISAGVAPNSFFPYSKRSPLVKIILKNKEVLKLLLDSGLVLNSTHHYEKVTAYQVLIDNKIEIDKKYTKEVKGILFNENGETNIAIKLRKKDKELISTIDYKKIVLSDGTNVIDYLWKIGHFDSVLTLIERGGKLSTYELDAKNFDKNTHKELHKALERLNGKNVKAYNFSSFLRSAARTFMRADIEEQPSYKVRNELNRIEEEYAKLLFRGKKIDSLESYLPKIKQSKKPGKDIKLSKYGFSVYSGAGFYAYIDYAQKDKKIEQKIKIENLACLSYKLGLIDIITAHSIEKIKRTGLYGGKSDTYYIQGKSKNGLSGIRLCFYLINLDRHEDFSLPFIRPKESLGLPLKLTENPKIKRKHVTIKKFKFQKVKYEIYRNEVEKNVQIRNLTTGKNQIIVDKYYCHKDSTFCDTDYKLFDVADYNGDNFVDFIIWPVEDSRSPPYQLHLSTGDLDYKVIELYTSGH